MAGLVPAIHVFLSGGQVRRQFLHAVIGRLDRPNHSVIVLHGERPLCEKPFCIAPVGNRDHFGCRSVSVWIDASPNSAVAEFGTIDAQIG
jgi:hypothetical protein